MNIKLDLACGNNKQEGFTGVDKYALESVDIVRDLEQYPWPWEDNSVEEIFCRYYLNQTKDLIAFMEECYRVLIPEGTMKIICPYHATNLAWEDPYNIRGITEGTFAYFSTEHRKAYKLEHYPIKTNFSFQYGYVFSPMWQSRHEESKLFALIHYHNAAPEIHVTLKKEKLE